MQQYRRGEEGQTIPPRAERFYKLEDEWYFNVRGGKTFGPYACREQAANALEKLLNPVREYKGNVRPFGNLRARRWRNASKF